MTKERPILFNGAMVRAILAGRKTQTRRVVKVPPAFDFIGGAGDDQHDPRNWGAEDENALWWALAAGPDTDRVLACPFGQPGDRLWVRETTVNVEDHGYVGPVYVESEEGRTVLNSGLAPDPDDCTDVEPEELRLRPSIHMPRSMCRLVLEITDVRVERLQAISEADAIAEGLTQTKAGGWLPGPCDHPEWAFHLLWNQVYGESSWDSNPWVWAITFKRIEA
ncbi:hypothetical protein [Stenotrophomonas sp. PSU-St15]